MRCHSPGSLGYKLAFEAYVTIKVKLIVSLPHYTVIGALYVILIATYQQCD